jgi:VWFA-related protein
MFAENLDPSAIKDLRCKTTRKLVVLLTLAFGALWSSGQTVESPSHGTSVTVKAEEMSLDLVVHDKKQRPVLDLKPEDVAITDNGDPVKLTSLRLVSSGSDNDHLITLVFDYLNPSVKKNAAAVAGKILRATPGEFSIAVLKIEPGRLGLLEGFTSDRKTLDQAVSAAIEPETSATTTTLEKLAEENLIAAAETGADQSGTRVSAKDRALSRTLLTAIQASARIVQDQHTQSYLSELLALVGSQQRFSGRKVLVYFTQGTYTDSRGKEVMQSIISAASRAGISIYTIDLTALSQAAEFSTAFASDLLPGTLTGMAGENYSTRAQMEAMMATSFRNRSPAQELAVGTGGSYIDSTHDLEKPWQRMIQDMTTYYEAFYLPVHNEYDGKFRSVDVKPLRKGIKIQAREGYFALPPESASGIQPFELPLLNILSGAQLPSDLAFRAAILRLGSLPGKDGNTLAIEVPLSGVEIRQDTNTNLYSAQISILARIKTKAGTIIEKFSEDVPCRGALEQVEEARSQVVTLQRHFDAPPGEYVLETAILDRASGKAGARQINFEIPNTSDGPSLEDMVLVQRIEPFQVETDPLEPLWSGSGKVTPNLSGDVRREAKTASVFFVTHTDLHSSEPATLDIQMFKNGEVLDGMSTASKQISGQKSASHLATFALTSLPDGSYEVKAILSQGGKITSTKTSFTLGGIQPAGQEIADANADLGAPGIEAALLPPAIKFSTGSVQPRAADQIKSILADASDRAIKYGLSLPNLICTQVTNRSVDVSGQGKWKHQDTITERLTYLNNVEKRTILMLNGNPTKTKTEHLIGALSEGELGGILKAVFEPSSKADFQWKERGMLGNGAVDVFDYQVLRENSALLLERSIGSNQAITPGLHGQIFIDSATHGIRRLTMVADDLPKTFFIRATSVSVDYDYIGIGGHDFLLPIRAQVGLKQRGHKAMLNEIEFRDYRRFGSKVKITPLTQP